MRRFQICKREHDNKIAIDWGNIPESMVTDILPEFIYNVFYLKEGKLDIKSVIYFRQVQKFSKHIVPFKFKDNIEFGI